MVPTAFYALTFYAYNMTTAEQKHQAAQAQGLSFVPLISDAENDIAHALSDRSRISSFLSILPVLTLSSSITILLSERFLS